MKEHILVVDDEPEIADLIALCLENQGFSVKKCSCGADALQYALTSHVDLVVLDVMLPDLDGFTVCRKIREHAYYPIIMLTAKVDDTDKILGLTIGADDYITKPFNPLEVVARVRTQLRRYKRYNSVTDSEEKPAENPEEYDIHGLYIQKSTHTCTLFGKEISLTPTEFNVLFYLCEHMGNVVSAEELFQAVWGEKYFENSSNTVMAHIGRLREKLRDQAKNPKFIKTVWGVGYKIE